MRFAALALLVMAGCRGILGIEEAAHVEVDAAAAPACSAWTPRGIDACALPEPAAPLVLTQIGSPYTLDTTERTLRGASGPVEISWREVEQADQSKVFVIAVERLTVEAAVQLNVIGRLALVVASWSAIEVGGTIDAGSHRGGRPGSGANMSCSSMTGTAGMPGGSIGGSGGGGGGAFHGRGGAGGAGGTAVNGGGGGGLAIPTPGVLRAGCAGGDSGAAGASAADPSSSATRSPGGAGGGAILLAARESIVVFPAAAVLAGGAGGGGAQRGSTCGGGGGGAGGYIGLQADLVDVRGALAANGGGGGGSAPPAETGAPGQDGQRSDRAATGGASASSCGAGGADGAAGDISSGGSGASNTTCGGAGGGGGAGLVMVWAAAYQSGTDTVVSPRQLLNMP